MDFLEHLAPRLQPIVSLAGDETWEVVFWEALLGPISLLPDQSVLKTLRRAELTGAVLDIDTAMITAASRVPARTSVNISRRSIDLDALALLATLDTARPDQLILEITERPSSTHADQFAHFVHESTRRGFALALDDYGTGEHTRHSPMFTPLSRIVPAVVKLGLEPFRAVSILELKQMVRMCRRNDQLFVVEGVETASHLEKARAAGVPAAQGFFWRDRIPPPA